MATTNPGLGFTAATPLKRQALAAGVVGLGLTAFGFLLDRTNFFAAYLQAYMWVLAMPMGCLGLLMLHNLVGGNWGWTIRPFLESGLRTLPLIALLFLPILGGLHSLYPWTNHDYVHHDPALLAKAAYLNVPFWLARTAGYFALWITMAFFLRRWLLPSPQASSDIKALHRVQRLSAIGLLLYVLTMSFAAIDWLMSIEPHWFSSIFGVIVIVGHANTTFGLCLLMAIYMNKRHPNPWMAEKNIHDLGKLLFMTIMVWGYTNLSQYLIIWSGNMPEETFWYHERSIGGWKYLSAGLVMFQFIIPFCVLLSKRAKTNPKILTMAIGVMLVVRLIEMIYLVSPGMRMHSFPLHWMDFTAALGLGGLWFAAFLFYLRSNSGVPAPAGAAHGGPQDHSGGHTHGGH